MTGIKHDSRVNSSDGSFMRLLRRLARLVGLSKETRGVEAAEGWIGFDRDRYYTNWKSDPDSFGSRLEAWSAKNRLRQEAIRPGLSEAGTVEVLAQSYLDKAEEDYTWVDPQDIKRLARAVLSK